jgi:alpha-galactosidase
MHNPRSSLCTAKGRFAAVLLLATLATAAAASATGQVQTCLSAVIGQEPAHKTVWLENLNLDAMEQGWGTPHAGQSVEGNPLTLGGRVYEHGVGTHASSEILIDLKGNAERFHAVVGIDDEEKGSGSAVFVILVDGKEAERIGVLRGGDAPQAVSVVLAGAKQLALLVEDAGDGIECDHADWADAELLLSSGESQPEAVVPDPGPEPELAPVSTPEPAIHAPHITGATPGHPFLFRIPATGEGPLRFSAKGLPDGLKLDPETGIISGPLASEGRTQVEITVEGPRGKARSRLTIVGGRDSLALTPPLGWNSWNVWGTSVDDAKVRAAADWMVKSGLAAHGYQYIDIDDAWQGERDRDGAIHGNDKFPDMKGLCDYVHGLGLKLGIYSSPGPTTCAGYEGSYGHESDDAKTYAEWGVDLLKYDWCSYDQIAPNHSREELTKPYLVMHGALENCGRDIVYSLCQYGMGNVSEWGDSVGGNCWRTTGDINDSWSSMSGIGLGQNGLEGFAGPGHWNDPDMLVVGKLGWGPSLHSTGLSPNEQVTHITLWSLLAAPMLIGCDLSQLDGFTVALLTNPEVLEVSQDALGKQARRAAAKGQQEMWARPLADGTMAVGLFNRGRGQALVTVRWDDLGLKGPQPVRDLWLRKDVGTFDGEYSAQVSRHGAMLLKIGAPR